MRSFAFQAPQRGDRLIRDEETQYSGGSLKRECERQPDAGSYRLL